MKLNLPARNGVDIINVLKEKGHIIPDRDAELEIARFKRTGSSKTRKKNPRVINPQAPFNSENREETTARPNRFKSKESNKNRKLTLSKLWQQPWDADECNHKREDQEPEEDIDVDSMDNHTQTNIQEKPKTEKITLSELLNVKNKGIKELKHQNHKLLEKIEQLKLKLKEKQKKNVDTQEKLNEALKVKIETSAIAKEAADSRDRIQHELDQVKLQLAHTKRQVSQARQIYLKNSTEASHGQLVQNSQNSNLDIINSNVHQDSVQSEKADKGEQVFLSDPTVRKLIETLKTKLEQYNIRDNELSMENKKVQEALMNSQNKNAYRRKKISDMRTQHNRHCDEATGQIQKLVKENENLVIMIRTLKEENSKLNNEFENKQQNEIGRLRVQIKELKNKHLNEQKNLKQHQEELAQLRKLKNEDRNILKVSEDQWNKEKENMKREIEKFKSHLSSLDEEASQMSKENQNFREQLEKLQILRKEDKEQHDTRFDREIELYKKRLQTSMNQKNKISQSLIDTKKALAERSRNMEILNKKYLKSNQLVEKYKACMQQIQLVQTQIGDLKEIITQKNSENAMLQTKLADSNKISALIKDKLAHTETELQKWFSKKRVQNAKK